MSFIMKCLVFLVIFISLIVHADLGIRNFEDVEELLAKSFPVKPTFETISNCGKPEDILEIKYIRLSPDPPLKGQELDIDAAGYLKEAVVQGSYINLVVKYGLVKLLQKRLDLCEEVEKVNKKCPLEKGDQVLQHKVELPRDIPPGKYIVDANVYTPDNRQIACLKAIAFFKP